MSDRMRTRWIPWAALGALLLLVGCKAREGDTCRCASDCRSGLQCVAEGRNTPAREMCGTAQGCCHKEGTVGVCQVSDDSAGEGTESMTGNPEGDEYPQTKRDLASPTGASESASSTATDTDATTDATGSSSTTATTTTTTDATTTDATTTDATTTDATTTDATTTDATTDATTSTTDATTTSTTDATTTDATSSGSTT